MKVPIDDIGNDVYVLEITVFNSAMLQSSITKEVHTINLQIDGLNILNDDKSFDSPLSGNHSTFLIFI